MNRNPRRSPPTARRPRAPRLVTIAAIATLGWLASGGAAQAMTLPDPPGPHPAPHAPNTITHVIHTGTPLWMFLLVAVASIALTALIAVAATRRSWHLSTTPTGQRTAGLTRP